MPGAADARAWTISRWGHGLWQRVANPWSAAAPAVQGPWPETMERHETCRLENEEGFAYWKCEEIRKRFRMCMEG